jgi:Cu-Zn family superoxide dismutase
MRRAMVVVSGSFLYSAWLLAQPAPPTATAELKSSDGRSLGAIRLTERADGVAIEGKVTSLPAGIHAIHVHEVGKCDPPMFESAGGHFNPTGAQHGSKNPKGSHAGDLPNITIPPTGTFALNIKAADVTLRPGQRSLFDTDGSSLVVHSGPDDLSTDPDGMAGPRVACGVIVK